MTAKIVPLFDDPGFFGGCKISDAEAPREIVAAEELSYDYFAVVWKYSGSIEAADFLRFARRLSVLCFQVFGRATIELRVDPRAPFNFVSIPGAMSEMCSSDSLKFNTGHLNYNAFRVIFASSFSVGLRITQKTSYWSDQVSHALIEWNGHKPDIVFISAHRGDSLDPRTGDRQLEKLLLRKLFNVPGAPPDHLFDVNLGFEAWNDVMLEP